jgi:hypothetical protein
MVMYSYEIDTKLPEMLCTSSMIACKTPGGTLFL